MKGKAAVIATVALGGAFILSVNPAQLAQPPPPSIFSQIQAQNASACTPLGQAAVVEAVSGRYITDDQAARFLYNAGFRGEDIAIGVAVGHGETGDPTRPATSRIDAQAFNPASGGNKGWLQINLAAHPTLVASGNVMDPADNAVMAFAVFSERGNWEPWQAYTRGSYRPLMPRGRAALARLAAGAPDASASPECLVPPPPSSGEDPVRAEGIVLSDAGPGPMRPADKLRPRAAKGKALTLQIWGCDNIDDPCVHSVGGYAYRKIAGSNKLSKHADGLANDIFLDKRSKAYLRPENVALGQQIADFYVVHYKELGVDNVIWNDRIYNEPQGWHEYHENARTSTSDVLRHRDHVHVDYESG